MHVFGVKRLDLTIDTRLCYGHCFSKLHAAESDLLILIHCIASLPDAKSFDKLVNLF